ncbi:MAG: twin-arginine translocation signal domain-containing protein, partial [Pirellulales bacterium]|nr:twin-arginine translocation signal domain-containing protein [Pirellulales bacterium]
MSNSLAMASRRRFLGQLAAAGAAALALPNCPRAGGTERPPLSKRPDAPDHVLTVIRGGPRERGRAYGARFAGPIAEFLDREIYQAFAKQGAPGKDDLLCYADACFKPVRKMSSTISEELEGIAEGAGIRLEEAMLISLHEELWHRGVLPPVEHCTALAIGPPATCDGHTYVAQSWDWMTSVYGKSHMLLWQREEGPSLLSYAYPGLWAGAGLNSA